MSKHKPNLHYAHENGPSPSLLGAGAVVQISIIVYHRHEAREARKIQRMKRQGGRRRGRQKEGKKGRATECGADK